ncbi:uncharacterized protein LOC118278989 isoform X2 [Spodoptera frugiperda]|uniref:Uncharacterized protein LOC118278989 isoform X1 n=1 Tax=Spodoptera frugiperda TaxID=7108 RepID=A0A9R0DIE1_SPOFR|nr:uncharacterized protein LOC118278989 isoform X1 [Spodoptera frugiperda]XP_050557634.1 uncharacterized protein LOC118278989 isoform X2 [Spodoptera frugiperda]
MCCGGGGGCGGCGTSIGNWLYVFEKLASFCALTAVVICLILTLCIMLGLGIGLGYNYCYVDLRVRKPSSGSARRSGEELDEPSLETEDFRRRMDTTYPVSQRTTTLPTIKATMQIPLNGEIDLEALFSKLRGRNRNVTLELIT